MLATAKAEDGLRVRVSCVTSPGTDQRVLSLNCSEVSADIHMETGCLLGCVGSGLIGSGVVQTKEGTEPAPLAFDPADALKRSKVLVSSGLRGHGVHFDLAAGYRDHGSTTFFYPRTHDGYQFQNEYMKVTYASDGRIAAFLAYVTLGSLPSEHGTPTTPERARNAMPQAMGGHPLLVQLRKDGDWPGVVCSLKSDKPQWVHLSPGTMERTVPSSENVNVGPLALAYVFQVAFGGPGSAGKDDRSSCLVYLGASTLECLGAISTYAIDRI